MKAYKKFLSYLVSPFALGLLVTFGMIYAALDYYSSRHQVSRKDKSLAGLIQQIHEKTIDWRLTDRGQQLGSDRVAILAIDERSIEQEGRWPWPREKMAALVERTLADGAKHIAFDIVFSEEDQNSSIPTLRRLKRGLASQQKLTPDLGGMIETEIGQTDGDRVFATTIKRHADRLILGAYFDAAESRRPYSEFCYDARFERTYESRYWKKEALPITVVDQPLNQLRFPSLIKQHLSDYFVVLDVVRANEWFEENKSIVPKIQESLEDLSALLPAEAYPGLSTLWMNNDLEGAKPLLQQIDPSLGTDEAVRTVFNRFGAAFTKQEAAHLQQTVKKGSSTYCDHFLTDADELLSFERYKILWGDDESSKEQFASHALQNLWPKILASIQASSREPAEAKNESFETALERYRRDSLPNPIESVERWWVNFPLLGEVTKHTGYFNAKQDTDGSIRRTMLLARAGNAYMPSLALKSFLVDNGAYAFATIDLENVGRNEARAKILKSLEISDNQGNFILSIPIDNHGDMMINYSGGRNMFPYVSAADLLSDRPDLLVEQQVRDAESGRWTIQTKRIDKKEFLKDKILIAGATAIGVYDLRVTPFEENYPGVETHANALSNLLVEHARAKGERIPASAPGFLRSHPGEERIMWIVLLVMGLTISALLSYFGSIAGLGITGVALTGVYAFDKYYLFRSGIVTTVLFPTIQIFGTFVTLTFFKYFTEERKKRELKGTFEKYVSPAIVNEVLADPENIELGGKKMELTVMFSDVRGFTSISEKLDPRELSNLLNSYLTPMTDLVFKNKGTLDKYMGDAIMAFWGAPIHFPDHAKHAARCALQMISKLRELQENYRAKGLPEIDIGIGLNSGDMSVGNMGSDTVRSYTVMGDAVNLGSRLEGINKQYGTRIIISEFTQAQIKDSFVTREVDWVRVKGKAQPVRIFELMGEGKVSAQLEALLTAFNEGFTRYHEKRFGDAIECFQRALEASPDDAVSQLYIKRCEDYLASAPPENWDGVCVMKEK